MKISTILDHINSLAGIMLAALLGWASVTRTRRWLFCANTPWKRLRFTLGFGASGVPRRAMKSRSAKMMCEVPSR
jgi:hypothetical protein